VSSTDALAPNDTAPDDASPAAAPPGPLPPAGGRRWRCTLGLALDLLALVIVLAALLLPDRADRLAPGTFAALPVEPVIGLGVVLLLPARAGRAVAGLAGAVLAVLTLGTLLDLGFSAVLLRPFDPVADWALLGDAQEFLTSSLGRAGAIGATVAAIAVALAALASITGSVLRLARLATRRRVRAVPALAVLALVWTTCAALGSQLVPGVPLAADRASSEAGDRVRQVAAGLADRHSFAAQAAVDAFRDTPGDRLLTGLRGKNVVVAFVESYGRSAVQDPAMAGPVDALLDDGSRRLSAAGFGSRSAFLTSPTAGGGSVLAHSTLLSGLWIDDQQRYRTLVSSDRLTLNEAFRRAGWRTVGMMPGVTRAWPEGRFYGYDQVYDSGQMGYRGPHFSWAPMPDQYALAALQRSELGPARAAGAAPVMAEIPLVSSHGPWAPLPTPVDWNAVGDGSVFDPMPAAGAKPDDVWRAPAQVRDAYRQSVQYTLDTLISFVRTYGDRNLVLVFLGDHQPVPIVTGDHAGRDVPITIVAKDPAVLDRISGWGWQNGLRPGPTAPVWRMDAFRDKFLTAFGPAAG
jgi:hypothetical protein